MPLARHFQRRRGAGDRRRPSGGSQEPHLPAAGPHDLRDRPAGVRGHGADRGAAHGSVARPVVVTERPRNRRAHDDKRHADGMTMRILFLSQRVPHPPNRGDKCATYHYVRHLARRHEVAVACLADGPADLENVAGLSSLTRSVDAVVCSPIRRRARALTALAGGRPLTVAYFDEPELRARVRARLAAERFDVALVYGSGVAQYVEDAQHLPRVIQFSDLDSLKWEQYAAASRPPKRWVYRTEARRLLAYERYLAATFTRSLVCSDRERDEFRRRIPGVPVEVVRNGVDLSRFRPVNGDQEPHHLVFTGVMNYLPNVDGVNWFCREVFPRIRASVPAAKFTICG